MATILENSIKSLKKCYIGIGEDGNHTLDKSKLDELSFLCAITQVSMAIKKGLITEEQFMQKVSAGSELVGSTCTQTNTRVGEVVL